jgi:hypothetical protein
MSWVSPGSSISSLAASDGTPAQALAVDANGQVGIGTASPASALDVVAAGTGVVQSLAVRANPGGVGASNLNSIIFDNLYGPGNFKNQFSLRAAGLEKWALGNDYSGAGNQNFYIYDAASGKARFFIASNGAVQTGSGGVLGFSNNSNPPAGAIDAGMSRLAANKIAFGNGTQADYSATLVAGNVGIGTSSPTYALHVAPQSATAGQTMFIQDATATTGKTGVLIKEGAANTWGDFPLRVQDNSGSDLLFVESGNKAVGANVIWPTVLSTGGVGSTKVLTLSGAQSTSGVGSEVNIKSWNDRYTTSGSNQTLLVSGKFMPSSGNAVLNAVEVAPTVEQTGAASGVTRGLYVNATINSAVDYRAIETEGGKVVLNNSGGTPLTINRKVDDGVLIDLQQEGTSEGSISVAGSLISFNPFTGSHYGWTDDATVTRGMLVSMTGANERLNEQPTSEIIYGFARTQRYNDPGVLGAYLARQGETTNGTPISLVMAVGNGEMWVVDSGTPLAVGDYLIASDVAGHAMKDDAHAPVSHVVGRVAEPIDWSDAEVMADGHRHKLVSVFFDNFSKDNATRADVDRMQARLDAMQAYLCGQQPDAPFCGAGSAH